MAECRLVGRGIADLGDVCARALVKFDGATDADAVADVATIVRLVGGRLGAWLARQGEDIQRQRVAPASAMALAAIDRHLDGLQASDAGARDMVGRSLSLVIEVERILAGLAV